MESGSRNHFKYPFAKYHNKPHENEDTDGSIEFIDKAYDVIEQHGISFDQSVGDQSVLRT